MRFLNKEHENKLMGLIQDDGTHPKDVERISLFYILSGNTDLYVKSRHIYDFMNHQIVPDCLYDGGLDFFSSSRALIRLSPLIALLHHRLMMTELDFHSQTVYLYFSLLIGNYQNLNLIIVE